MVAKTVPKEDLREVRVKALVNFANNFLHAGNYEEALATFDKAIAEDPVSLRAHMGRGLALARLGRYKEALEVADYILENLDVESSSAYNVQGICFHGLGRDDDAAAAFGRAVDAEPMRARNHYNFACYWAGRANATKCRESLAMALALEPHLNVVAATDVDLARFRNEPWFEELVAFKERE